METLLVGNTGYITQEFIQDTFPDDSVVVLGNSRIRTSKKTHITSYPDTGDRERAEDIIDGYRFERVVYFSNYLTLHSTLEGELEQLRRILGSCVKKGVAQVVYLTSLEGCYGEKTGKIEIVEASERLCMYYAEVKKIQVKMIRLPFLYSAEYSEDFLYKKLEETEKGQEIVWEELPEHPAYFLCMDDLSELLFRIFDSWDSKSEILNVPDRFHITFGLLAECMKKQKADIKIAWSGTADEHVVPEDDKILRHKYGWFPRISILEDFPYIYETYQKQKETPEGRLRSFSKWAKEHVGILKVVELAAGFIVMELLNHISGDNVQFRMIDYRLLYVVIMGSLYGIDMGTGAAFLASFSLVYAYMASGTNWLTLFYEPSNWIPFLAYFIVGAICGYVRLKNQESIKFVKRENELIQEKFFFMKDLYQDTLQDKRKYKKQIMGSRDSFGKIFEVTRQLDVTRPQEVFAKSIQVMEDVLDNQTIAIYSLGRNKNFGRLEVCSRNLLHQLPNSVRIEEYAEALPVLENGEVWSNTELFDNYPMYIAGIRGEEGLVLLIMIYKSTYEQMGLYYLNLIRILCGLVESSMLRAMEYQQMIREQNYIGDTNILKEPHFLETLRIRHDMLEQHMAEYALIRLNKGDMTLEEADNILRMKTRENDVLGVSSDGTIYLILAQAAASNVDIVVKRLEQSGFKCKIVQQVGEE